MAAEYYNMICLHKVGGISKDAIKYYNVKVSLLWDTIWYLEKNYRVDVIFIYDSKTKSLLGWYRTKEPKKGLSWK